MRFAVLDISPVNLQVGDIFDEIHHPARSLTVEAVAVLLGVVWVDWVGGDGCYLPRYRSVRVLRPLSSSVPGSVL